MSNELSVGAQARRIRLHRGETLEQVSKRTGISLNQLSRVERGESIPSEHTIRALATVLEVPVSVLFGETISPPDFDEILRGLIRHAVMAAAQQVASPTAIEQIVHEVENQLL